MSGPSSSGKKGLDLQWKILIGIVAGLVLGIFFNQIGAVDAAKGSALWWINEIFARGGDIFVRLLRMLIVPLVFASIFMAIVNLGDIRELGKIGSKTILYYFVTTALAVLVGLILVNIIHPGYGVDTKTLEAAGIGKNVPAKVAAQDVGEKPTSLIIADVLINMVPKNPAAAFAKGTVLQIIFFSIFLAVVAAIIGRETDTFVSMVSGLDKMMNKSVMVVMELAPYCIFLLVTSLMMKLGFPALKALAKYGTTVLVGLAIHAAITLPLLVAFIGRYNPFKLFKAMLPAIMTAWSTASSAATLPITMDSLERRAGVERRIGNFVLPLGATVNMDGTALYESIAVIFIAELLGFHLTIAQQVIVFITATLAAIGAAAIPGAGLVTMGIVLTAVGLPLDGIGLILAIDRILDQFRTAVNVWGDATAGVVIGHLENAIHDVSAE
jgi:Na+/H+-dicarboxylate symporter